MKTKSGLAVGLALALAVAGWMSAKAAGPGADAPTTAPSEHLQYMPPEDPGPVNRLLNARSRGSAGVHLPNLWILASAETGRTVKPQPSLFWYLDAPTQVGMVLTLTKAGEADPVLEMSLDGSKVGIQRIDLSAQKITLEPGAQYDWNLNLVPDAKNRDRDVKNHAAIKRIRPPESLVKALTARTGGLDRAFVFAKDGVWYDALASISDEIDAHPSEGRLHQERANLLAHAGLAEAAAFDSKLSQVP